MKKYNHFFYQMGLSLTTVHCFITHNLTFLYNKVVLTVFVIHYWIVKFRNIGVDIKLWFRKQSEGRSDYDSQFVKMLHAFFS